MTTAEEKEHRRQIQRNIEAAALRAKASRLEAEARNPEPETPKSSGFHPLRAVAEGVREGKAEAAKNDDPMTVGQAWWFVLFAAFGMKIIEGAVWGFAFTSTPDWWAVLYVLLLVYSVILLIKAYRDRSKARSQG